jgi:hypothetical protein
LFPQQSSTIEDCFHVGRMYSQVHSRPPPLIIIFINERLQMAVLHNKEFSMLSPSEEKKAVGQIVPPN